MTVSSSPRIFVTSSYNDREFASRLSKAIMKEGAHSFLDVDAVKAGEHWQKQLQSRLKDSDMVLLVLPAKEGDGKSALFEVGAAMAMGKPVCVVVKDWSATSSANTAFATNIAGHQIVDASRKPMKDVARDIVAKVQPFTA